MTTPTPRTDAIALDRNDSHRHPDCSDRIVGWTDYEALRDRSREIERDLAARDAELAELMKWKEAVVNELIVAHIYSQAHDDSPRKAVHDAITWHCQVEIDPAVSSDARKLRDTYLQRAEAAEQERDSAVSWNHRVSVCEKHTAEIVDGPCVICELEAAERKVEGAYEDIRAMCENHGEPIPLYAAIAAKGEA